MREYSREAIDFYANVDVYRLHKRKGRKSLKNRKKNYFSNPYASPDEWLATTAKALPLTEAIYSASRRIWVIKHIGVLSGSQGLVTMPQTTIPNVDTVVLQGLLSVEVVYSSEARLLILRQIY
eukprot:1947472-Ditylum_brightwellii.AAC.2